MPKNSSPLPNLYELAGISPAEREALRSIPYANVVSRAHLGNALVGKLVADLGAGTEPDLGRWVVSQGARYAALDIVEEACASLREAGLTAFRGNMDAIPSTFPEASVVHARFVLMHMKPVPRAKAVKEALRIASNRALFIEFDWTPFGGGVAVNAVRDWSVKAFMGLVDLRFGARLKNTIVAVAKHKWRLVETRHRRPLDNYYHEFVPRARAMVKPANALVERGMLEKSALQEYHELLSALEREAARKSPDPFVPPDIVVVEAVRQ